MNFYPEHRDNWWTAYELLHEDKFAIRKKNVNVFLYLDEIIEMTEKNKTLLRICLFSTQNTADNSPVSGLYLNKKPQVTRKH